ncbi:hypothetical protein D3C80_1709230 [compost metagenome]
MGREQARGPGPAHQFAAQRFAGAVVRLALVVLTGNHLLGDELPRSVAQRTEFGAQLEVHGTGLL